MITAQGFISQFNGFMIGQARVPQMPVRMGGESVVYGFYDGSLPDPIDPLIRISEKGIFVRSLASFPRGSEKGKRTMSSELDRLHLAVTPIGMKYTAEFRSPTEQCNPERVAKERVERRPKRQRGGARSPGVERESADRRSGEVLNRPKGLSYGFGESFLRMNNLFIGMARGSIGDEDDVAGRVIHVVRRLRREGEFTAAACFAELGASICWYRTYHSAAAADCWLESLSQYDDPASARMRISRGIYNAARFPNRRVVQGLFDASASIYMKEGRHAESASEHLRSLWFSLNSQSVYPLSWSDVVEQLGRISSELSMARADTKLIDGLGELMRGASELAAAG